MKFIASVLLTALLSFALCLFLPWWLIAVAAFVVAVAIPQKAGIAFLSGFLGVFFLWAIMSFMLSNANGHLLAHKVSLLIMHIDSPFLLIMITGLIGGLVAGLGALSGSLLRNRP